MPWAGARETESAGKLSARLLGQPRAGIWALMVCLFASGWSGVRAQAYDYVSDNDAAMALFHMGGTARGQAMGGAYVSLARGAEAVYWNPGGLAYQPARFEISVSPRIFQGEDYALGDDARSFIAAQGGFRWRTWALGVGFLHHSIGDILYNDGTVDGDPVGSGGPNDVSTDRTFSNGQTGLVLAAGGTFLKDHLGVGAGVRRLSNSFAGLPPEWEAGHPKVATSGNGLSLEAGATYRVNEDLAVAGVVDLPSKVDWGGRTDDGAMRMQTGASYRFLRRPTFLALASVQLENIGGSWARAHLGAEITGFRVVSIRAGLKNLHLKSSVLGTSDLNDAAAFTIGVGTADLKVMARYPVRLDLSVDSQDFNSQIVTTLTVGL